MSKVEITFEEIDGFMRIKIQSDLNNSTLQERILAQDIEEDIKDILNGVEDLSEETLH